MRRKNTETFKTFFFSNALTATVPNTESLSVLPQEKTHLVHLLNFKHRSTKLLYTSQYINSITADSGEAGKQKKAINGQIKYQNLLGQKVNTFKLKTNGTNDVCQKNQFYLRIYVLPQRILSPLGALIVSSLVLLGTSLFTILIPHRTIRMMTLSSFRRHNDIYYLNQVRMK